MAHTRRSFSERFTGFVSSILLRFYNEIIAGVWSILVFLPLDAYLYKIIAGHPSYEITTNYWIFFGFYTIFFLTSAALVPYIKEWYVFKELDSLEHNRKINAFQKKKIKGVISEVLIYKSIFSKEGLLQFFMSNIFCFGVILAYFGLEGIIANVMNNKTLIVPVIFLISFFVLLVLESFLDDYLSQKMRHNNGHKSYVTDGNKRLLILILRNLGGGGSLSANLSQILIEDAVDDIYEILQIASIRGGTKTGTTKKFILKNKRSLESKTRPPQINNKIKVKKRGMGKNSRDGGLIKNY